MVTVYCAEMGIERRLPKTHLWAHYGRTPFELYTVEDFKFHEDVASFSYVLVPAHPFHHGTPLAPSLGEQRSS